MWMSQHEISYEYRTARDKAAQIEILADLNAVSAWEMKKYLCSLGLDVPEVGRAGGRSLTGSRKARVRIDSEAAFRLYDEKKTDPQIAAALGVTESAIMYWRKRNGLHSNCERKRGFDQPKAMELYLKGKCDAEIAGELGMSRSTIGEWRRKRSLAANGKKKRG